MIACLSILRRVVRAFTRLAWRPRRPVRVVRLLPHGGAGLRPMAPVRRLPVPARMTAEFARRGRAPAPPRPWRDAP